MSAFERCVVLVADDEPMILHLATNALTRHGYIVLTAADGLSALRVCEQREGPIHLALLDVVMPGLTGPQLYECLAQVHPKISVLFMSGYTPQRIAETGCGISGVNFIAKPFRLKDLVERVNEILNNQDVCSLLDDETMATYG